MLGGDESTAPSVVLQFRSRAEGEKKTMLLLFPATAAITHSKGI